MMISEIEMLQYGQLIFIKSTDDIQLGEDLISICKKQMKFYPYLSLYNPH